MDMEASAEAYAARIISGRKLFQKVIQNFVVNSVTNWHVKKCSLGGQNPPVWAQSKYVDVRTQISFRDPKHFSYSMVKAE